MALPSLLFAQQAVLLNVKAKVSSTGGAIDGASVVVKGKLKATTTNNLGEFVLDGLTKDDIIVISAVGHSTREIKAGNIGTAIALEINKIELGGVVVTGYQRKSKIDFAGAATTISVKDVKVPNFTASTNGPLSKLTDL